MKRNAASRIVINIAVITVLTAILICGITNNGILGNSIFNIGNFINMGNTNDYSTKPIKLLPDEINSVEINWISGEINICPSNDEYFRAEDDYNGNKEKLKLCWKLEEKTLKIAFGKSSKFGFWNNHKDKKLDVYIPEVSLSKINELEIDTVSSDINIDFSESELNIKELEIDTTSGNTSITGVSSLSVNIDSVSGGISYHGKAEKISVDSVSGDTELLFDTLPLKGKFDSISGSVKLSIFGEDSFSADFSSVSGKFKCDLPTTNHGDKYIYGEGKSDLSFESVSGDVIINQR